MYLKDSKTVVIKIGSSLLINDKKIIRKKWLSEFAKDIQHLQKLKKNGFPDSKIEGKESSEWKLVDGIDLIVHIFHPEKRKFYELEKIWSEFIPKEKVMI